MSLFDHSEFDDHESVHYFRDPDTGLSAIIAVHSTRLGPAAGGCRRWVYASDEDALTDVLRLSRSENQTLLVSRIKAAAAPYKVFDSAEIELLQAGGLSAALIAAMIDATAAVPARRSRRLLSKVGFFLLMRTSSLFLIADQATRSTSASSTSSRSYPSTGTICSVCGSQSIRRPSL